MAVRELPDLVELLRGERGALSRLLTLVEREAAGARERLVEAVRSRPEARARRVVVSGPPGVGKSSILREVMRTVRERGETVAVLACDPASPYTNGAFLGDRVRWTALGEDEGIFIRSLAHREARLLSSRVASFADLLAAAGFDWVIVETVGAGQSEVLDPGAASRVIVLSPGCGDETQMLKAGFLEGGDVYVVNKVDEPGGERWARQLEEHLALARDATPPPVKRVIATTGQGIPELVDLLAGLRTENAAPAPPASAAGGGKSGQPTT